MLVIVLVTVVVADVSQQLQALLILADCSTLLAEVQAAEALTSNGVVTARLTKTGAPVVVTVHTLPSVVVVVPTTSVIVGWGGVL